ncbi:PKD domain-containing protein [Solemya velum gill symbiont]|uniref:PKD domain-containing protein n=1 Tax=Solemya velum gill symbiont TaxID=2340 RepID=A0A0B0HBI4_SOVGS|nr:PKD domain-containing protein [Solemya velum gill symbiont]KHF24801.1 hypothetical protein JV46_08150 [Solemya velum gill symbiont]OOY53252.1 hypothetical protein BOV97_02730 [Solemya velum gill symbiont]OOY57103.1 hypothetical protein BOV99_02435 [Solemya velum gill symbiont]OOY58289.1 hypothetical protein BOW00_02980 [Solemya velum gill symbiont]OOY61938.1 hypothetical protein BOW02_00825 [Solemya velum gill symbiont]
MNKGTYRVLAVFSACVVLSTAAMQNAAAAFSINAAKWESGDQTLVVKGKKDRRRGINFYSAGSGDSIGSVRSSKKREYEVEFERLSVVPCRVRGVQSDGKTAERDVANAPDNCDGVAPPPPPEPNRAPEANANGSYNGTAGIAVNFSSKDSKDEDGTIVSYAWSFGDGTSSSDANPTHTYATPALYNVSLTVTDDDGATDTDNTTAEIIASTVNAAPIANANGPYSANTGDTVNFSSAGSSDNDGSITSYSWNFGDGNTSTSANPSHSYALAGTYSVSLTVVDNDGADNTDSTSAVIEDEVPPPPGGTPDVSINSTAVDSSGQNTTVVQEQPVVGNNNYSILAINDLGMHCGDLDTRISSILPPFQVLLAQVIQKGAEPTLNPAGIDLYYSAASNPNDPALGGPLEGVKDDGSTYKTNFWEDAVNKNAYDPFYPGGMGITPLASGGFPVTSDVGLPVPNAEHLYLGHDESVGSGDEGLSAVQHAMPGLIAPYSPGATGNAPQKVQEYAKHKPFFINFPFGYVAEDVDWYEAAGIPLAGYDDFGRANPYPLVRVEATNGSNTVSTLDTVLPISGEASCTNCHTDNTDYTSVHGIANRTSGPTDALTDAGLDVATSLDDPDSNMPIKVSLEYAADINILRLHDLKHGANYVAPSINDDETTVPAPCDITANSGEGDANCLANQALVQGKPVVCQVCHYTPALDLAQFGPLTGPEGSLANGRNQLSHKSNSNVMHGHHGQYDELFTPIPAPIQTDTGVITNQSERIIALEQNCYQCHPGKDAQCLRGAMFNGGMLCSDCHGGMEQVGSDFTNNVSPTNPGAFDLHGNFYTDPTQPRVPWANEPGCGSCHTGDAVDNLAGTANTLTNTVDTNGNTDGIRLRQAFLTGDVRATPIVPTNKRFAEPAIPADFNGFANPGAGNPKLYRVSTGHGGVMCEGCHGATHAEWPNENPNANDNVAAIQLQGHTGTITECSTCHGTAMNNEDTLGGPHGMHPVGDTGFAREGHVQMSKDNPDSCRTCHGQSGEGTVLSRVATDRVLQGKEDNEIHTMARGDVIGCGLCHENKLPELGSESESEPEPEPESVSSEEESSSWRDRLSRWFRR